MIEAGRHLGFDLASLSGACHGYMPPRLKTKQTQIRAGSRQPFFCLVVQPHEGLFFRMLSVLKS